MAKIEKFKKAFIDADKAYNNALLACRRVKTKRDKALQEWLDVDEALISSKGKLK